jgi:hypothetical protein
MSAYGQPSLCRRPDTPAWLLDADLRFAGPWFPLPDSLRSLPNPEHLRSWWASCSSMCACEKLISWRTVDSTPLVCVDLRGALYRLIFAAILRPLRTTSLMIPIKQRVVEGSMLRLIKQSLTAEIAYERKAAAGRTRIQFPCIHIYRMGGRILLKPA